MNQKRSTTMMIAGLMLIVACRALILLTPTIGNVWGLAMERAFVIPNEAL